MATIYGSSSGSAASAYTIWLECIINSQDISNNTSNITVNFKCQRTDGSMGGYSYTGAGSNYATLVIGGSTIFNDHDTGTVDLTNQRVETFDTWTGPVSHNTDGTLTLTVSASWRNIRSTYLSGGSVSGSWTLTTIPRASTVSLNNFTIGTTPTLSINRASTDFTHTLKYRFATQSDYTQIATGAGATFAWNTAAIKATLYALIPTGLSGVMSIQCDTYNGSTYIGTIYASCTALVDTVDSAPTLSATAVDSNATTINLTGSNAIFVKNFSNAYIVPTASAKNSATLGAYTVTIGSKNYSNGSVPGNHTVLGVDSGTISISVTDSRGLTTTITLTRTLKDYAAVIVGNCAFNRQSAVSTTVVISALSGSWWNYSFGALANILTLSYRWRILAGSWSAPISLASGFTTYTLAGTFVATSVYEFEFTAADRLSTVVRTLIVSSGTPHMDWGPNEIKFNKPLKLAANASSTTATNFLFNTGDGIIKEKTLANVKTEILTPPANIAPTLLNTLTNWDPATEQIAGYYKMGGRVYLQGTIRLNSAVAPFSAFVLPAGYRPTKREYFLTNSNFGSCSISVGSDGNVYVTALNNTWISFNGIDFMHA